MADVFSQMYIQIIFAVKNRDAKISSEWEDDLYKYITGIVQNKGNKLLAIGGMPDHIHIFIGMKPNENLSDLVREVKKSSQAFITYQKFAKNKFLWQAGYGAFSYSHSHIDRVCKYIQNQKEHHRKKSFRQEFESFIEKYNIDHGLKEQFNYWPYER